MTKKQEFNKKFVEPIDTKTRAMNLNNEPCVIGTEKEVWAWIEEKDKEQLEKTIDILKDTLVDIHMARESDMAYLDLAEEKIQERLKKIN